MYRIRLASGDETTYQSMDEFAAALHGGTVTAGALIYHQRADRWLSVTNHPHYQIALTRAQSHGARNGEGSKRQVISAVRPAGEVPATRVTPSAELPSSPVRKLTIPTARKPESAPPSAPAAQPVSPKLPVSDTGSKTTVLPLRTPAKAPEPVVPDLGDGLDLVEVEEVVAEVTPQRSSTATPQVDKLLEMLEPSAPATPVAAKSPQRQFAGEVLDLGAPVVKPTPPSPTLNLQLETPAPAPHPAPVSQQKKGNSPKVAGLVAAAVLVIGAVMFVWKPWSSRALPKGTEIASTTLPRTEAFGGSTANPAPTTAQISGSPSIPSTDSAKAPAKPVDSAPAIVRVAAPRNLGISVPTTNLVASSGAAGLNISATQLIQHYNAGYNEARSELELRMLQIGFTQIFLRSRLATESGVQDTRRLIAAANSALRQYRSQENQIERGYQDTIGVAGRNLGWTPHDLGTWNIKTGQKESGENLRLTNLMLSQLDSTFSLLAEQEGKYQISGDAITFQNTDAALQYGALRVWLNQQADKYAGSGDALPATLRQVVKAIGSTRLPQERR